MPGPYPRQGHGGTRGAAAQSVPPGARQAGMCAQPPGGSGCRSAPRAGTGCRPHTCCNPQSAAAAAYPADPAAGRSGKGKSLGVTRPAEVSTIYRSASRAAEAKHGGATGDKAATQSDHVVVSNERRLQPGARSANLGLTAVVRSNMHMTNAPCTNLPEAASLVHGSRCTAV